MVVMKTAFRAFAAGLGCGAIVGAFLVAVIVWRFGNVIGSRDDMLRRPADPRAATSRWDGGLDDAGGIIVGTRDGATGTTGTRAVDEDHAAVSPPSPAAAGEVPPLPPNKKEGERDLENRDLAMPVEGVRPD
jgi:hypothetical protein